MDMHNRYPNDSDYFCNLFREHFNQSFLSLLYCKQVEPVDPLLLEAKLIYLPPNPNSILFYSYLRKQQFLFVFLESKTLVFDLDETLVHYNENSEVVSDVLIPITFPNGEIIQVSYLCLNTLFNEF